jgi:hypothetical protein
VVFPLEKKNIFVSLDKDKFKLNLKVSRITQPCSYVITPLLLGLSLIYYNFISRRQLNLFT